MNTTPSQIQPPAVEPDDDPRPKKRRRRNIVPQPEHFPDAAPVLPEEVVGSLMNRAVGTIMKSAGFDGATPLAMEQVRQMAEKHYMTMLASIQHFTLAARRSGPTVLEYEDMLTQSGLPLSSLEDEMRRLPSPQILFPLRPPSPPPPPQPDLSKLLGPELDEGKRKSGEEHLPPLPSKHTYKSTPVFAERTKDPREIRELANKETRLAENALRNIMAATKSDNALASEGEEVSEKRKRRDSAWKKAFSALGKQEAKTLTNGVDSSKALCTQDSGLGSSMDSVPSKEDAFADLGVVVNADARFWRKGNAKRKRANG